MPHVPARHVGRPRLLVLLDAAEPGGLLLASAPAGYGKTLLLAEWAARRADRVAWLSLDDDDRAAPRRASGPP
jgi:LuxR family maltose regulon positive regulatory protein